MKPRFRIAVKSICPANIRDVVQDPEEDASEKLCLIWQTSSVNLQLNCPNLENDGKRVPLEMPPLSGAFLSLSRFGAPAKLELFCAREVFLL